MSERFDRSCSMRPEAQLSAKPALGARQWAELIAQHDHRVVLSLLARGVRLDRAREIAHETWAKLYEQYATGRLTRLELPGLAITQAAFIAAEDGRRAKAAGLSTPIDASPELEGMFDPHASVEQRLLGRELLERASAALDQCGARAQVVFSLAYENPDTPQIELAKKTGLSLQRVRQTLCEVRAKLRRAIEEGSDE